MQRTCHLHSLGFPRFWQGLADRASARRQILPARRKFMPYRLLPWAGAHEIIRPRRRGLQRARPGRGHSAVQFLRRFLLAALTAAAFSGTALAAGVGFVPHRAVYGLVLDRAKTDTAVNEASGELAVEWRRSCAGWTFEYRSLIDIGYTEGGRLQLVTRATTWEELDGRDFRFSVRHESNGKIVERIEGHAMLTNGGGSVTFSQPERKRLDLPRGTLFPIAHSLDILRVARTARPPVFHARRVFDGMDSDGAYLVNAVIGRSARAATGPAALHGLTAWPVHLGYFANSAEPGPRFELGMRLFDNGVTDDLVMALSEITLRGRIQRLQLLPDECPG